MIFNREIGECFKGPEHFDCAAELADLGRMQRLREFRFHSAELVDWRRIERLRDAELGEAGHGDAAAFERMQRLCAAELEDLRRMQGVRANKPVPEHGKDKVKVKDKGKVELAHHQKTKAEVAHPKDKGTVMVELAHRQKTVPGLALSLALFTWALPSPD